MMGVKFKTERHEVEGIWEMGELHNGALFKAHIKSFIFQDRVRYITRQVYVEANDELEAYQKARRGEWRA